MDASVVKAIIATVDKAKEVVPYRWQRLADGSWVKVPTHNHPKPTK